MIYASEEDAKLATRLDQRKMWKQKGPTSVNDVLVNGVDVGNAISTMVMKLGQTPRFIIQHIGTSINGAAPLTIQYASRVTTVNEVVLETPADMINAVRKAFGLNIKQLAEALHVERVTVYAWLRLSNFEKLHGPNRQRLQALNRLAKMWSKFTPLTGSYLLEIIPQFEVSIMDLLCKDELSEWDFTKAYELLAKALSPTDRATQAHAAKRAVFKKAIGELRADVKKTGMDLS